MTDSWLGEPAVTIAGPALTATVVPGRGAKIASLRDGAGREWLVQPEQPVAAPGRPGDIFERADMCGWDECAPTIDACRVGTVDLPDHGELWTASWEVDGARAVAAGTGFVFQRIIVPTDAGLRFDYTVSSRADIPFLWAAHPQFAAPPGSRVELPAGVSHVVEVLADEPRRVPWSEPYGAIERIRPGGCAKYYVDPDTAVSSAVLVRPDARLTVRWDPAVAPYLGVWVDRAAISHTEVIALEPATGYFDALDVAVRNGRVAVVRPGRPLRWSLDLQVDNAPDQPPATDCMM